MRTPSNRQVHYAVMSQGYMIVADGKPLETGKRETREFKTLDAAAKWLFKICTIYNAIPGLGEMEKTALALFNETILQEAFAARLPVIDLRLICNEDEDYSHLSSIEPSHAGGEKIARAIASLLCTHDFASGHSTVISQVAMQPDSTTI